MLSFNCNILNIPNKQQFKTRHVWCLALGTFLDWRISCSKCDTHRKRPEPAESEAVFKLRGGIRIPFRHIKWAEEDVLCFFVIESTTFVNLCRFQATTNFRRTPMKVDTIHAIHVRLFHDLRHFFKWNRIFRHILTFVMWRRAAFC